MSNEKRSCSERIQEYYNDTMETLRDLWESYCRGEEYCEKHGTGIYDYGLSFDYVAPGTFEDQFNGYFRYQLSWGGPSDEFRFYADYGGHPHCIEYWFLDWFDGAHITLNGEDRTFMEEIFQWFDDMGCVEKSYEEATEV